MPTPPAPAPVVVLGLGQFGRSAARALAAAGVEVLAVDQRADTVADVADEVTLAVEADMTSVRALSQLGVGDYARAVVAVSSSIETSVLATSLLVDLGVDEIIAKADNPEHARLLTRVGATVVVLPEIDAGLRVAQALTTGAVTDVAQTVDGCAFAVVVPPPGTLGRTVTEPGALGVPGVGVLAVRSRGEFLPRPVTAEYRVGDGDTLLVAGPATAVAELSAR